MRADCQLFNCDSDLFMGVSKYVSTDGLKIENPAKDTVSGVLNPIFVPEHVKLHGDMRFSSK